MKAFVPLLLLAVATVSGCIGSDRPEDDIDPCTGAGCEPTPSAQGPVVLDLVDCSLMTPSYELPKALVPAALEPDGYTLHGRDDDPNTVAFFVEYAFCSEIRTEEATYSDTALATVFALCQPENASLAHEGLDVCELDWHASDAGLAAVLQEAGWPVRTSQITDDSTTAAHMLRVIHNGTTWYDAMAPRDPDALPPFTLEDADRHHALRNGSAIWYDRVMQIQMDCCPMPGTLQIGAGPLTATGESQAITMHDADMTGNLTLNGPLASSAPPDQEVSLTAYTAAPIPGLTELAGLDFAFDKESPDYLVVWNTNTAKFDIYHANWSKYTTKEGTQYDPGAAGYQYPAFPPQFLRLADAKRNDGWTDIKTVYPAQYVQGQPDAIYAADKSAQRLQDLITLGIVEPKCGYGAASFVLPVGAGALSRGHRVWSFVTTLIATDGTLNFRLLDFPGLEVWC